MVCHRSGIFFVLSKTFKLDARKRCYIQVYYWFIVFVLIILTNILRLLTLLWALYYLKLPYEKILIVLLLSTNFTECMVFMVK